MPACTRWCPHGVRSAPAETWRRWLTSLSCSSARVRRSSTACVSPGRDALSAAGLCPIVLGPKEGLALINGTQPSTALLALRAARRRTAGARRGCRGRALDRRPARIDPAVRRAHPRGPAVRRTARVGREHRAAADGQRHQRLTRRLRARAGRILDAVRRPGPRRRPRCPLVHPPDRRDRGQRGHGQPDGLRRQRRHRVRRQLPWRTDRGRRRPAGDCASHSSPQSASVAAIAS